MSDRAWQHPWLRIQRLIRAILEVRRDPITRPVMKAMLVEALKERDKIHADFVGRQREDGLDTRPAPPRTTGALIADISFRPWKRRSLFDAGQVEEARHFADRLVIWEAIEADEDGSCVAAQEDVLCLWQRP
jgi:hypothetical protein